jgi:Ras-related protein Rab-5B
MHARQVAIGAAGVERALVDAYMKNASAEELAAYESKADVWKQERELALHRWWERGGSDSTAAKLRAKRLLDKNIPVSFEFCVVLLGSCAAGQSSLIRSMVHREFQPYSESTIGADFVSKTCEFGRMKVKLQIWGCIRGPGGKYHRLHSMYSPGADAALVIYDITDPRSFESARVSIEDARQLLCPSDAIIAMAGTKLDQKTGSDPGSFVQTERAQAYAKEVGAKVCMETSAKTGTNVDNLIRAVAWELVATRVDGVEAEADRIATEPATKAGRLDKELPSGTKLALFYRGEWRTGTYHSFQRNRFGPNSHNIELDKSGTPKRIIPFNLKENSTQWKVIPDHSNIEQWNMSAAIAVPKRTKDQHRKHTTEWPNWDHWR